MAKPRKAQPKPQAKAKALQEDVRHEPAGGRGVATTPAGAQGHRDAGGRNPGDQVRVDARGLQRRRMQPGEEGGGSVTTGTAAQCNWRTSCSLLVATELTLGF